MRKTLATVLIVATIAASMLFALPAPRASASSLYALPPAPGVLWYNTRTGETQLWYMNGANRMTGRATVADESGNAALIGPPWHIVGTGDADGNLGTDLLWYNDQTGETQIWSMRANRLQGRGTVVDESGAPIFIGPPWHVVAHADMDGDRRADIVWYNDQSGETQLWYMDSNRLLSRHTVVDAAGAARLIGPPWRITSAADMDGDGGADIVWHNDQTGETQLWIMDGYRQVGPATVVDEAGAAILVGLPWHIVATRNMDGRAAGDITWYNDQTGETQIWFMDSNRIVSRGTVLDEAGSAIFIGPPWHIVGLGSFSALPKGTTGWGGTVGRGDDYPYSPTICGHSGNCHGIDEWGFTKQQCVSFIAWRLSQRGVLVNGADYGDATNWDRVAQQAGYVVDTAPTVGSVAQWRSSEKSTWTTPGGGSAWMQAGPQGHVSYVTAVHADGTVDVEEYNQNSDESYHVALSIRAPRYIHF